LVSPRILFFNFFLLIDISEIFTQKLKTRRLKLLMNSSKK